MSDKIKERAERMKQRSVLICTPIRRDPVWQYTRSLASTLLALPEHGIRCGFQFVIGSSVLHKARNELCAHFLMSDFSDLLFVDDDMQWTPNDVMRLLGSDKPLIGGVGRMRVEQPNSNPAVWCWRPKLGPNKQIVQDDMGAVEALGFGAAFMLINRGVLHALATAHPEWGRLGAADWPQELRDHYFKFFEFDEDTHEVSEDYVFCNRWRALGKSVWVDPTIKLGHVGSFTFEGSLEDMLVSDGSHQEAA